MMVLRLTLDSARDRCWHRDGSWHTWSCGVLGGLMIDDCGFFCWIVALWIDTPFSSIVYILFCCGQSIYYVAFVLLSPSWCSRPCLL